jgi:alkylated DNA repair dioxygenase AlkB
MEPEVAWQVSLFDAGPIHADSSFSSLRRIQLDERSWVDYAPEWLAGSDELFALLLRRGNWRQRQVRMYERELLEPRLTAGWKIDGDSEDSGIDSGADDTPGTTPTSIPGPIADISALLSRRYEVPFDSVWVNLYRDGRDSVAWHGDRNARYLRNPLVVTVSLGARRRFLLRPKGTKGSKQELSPGFGDLVVMGGACQHDWEHTVPKTSKSVGPRMSVTIRHSTR